MQTNNLPVLQTDYPSVKDGGKEAELSHFGNVF